MVRVCFSLGTWQLVMLASALRQAASNGHAPEASSDYLVLYEPLGASEALKVAMQEVAGAIWKWEKIIWTDSLTADQLWTVSPKNVAARLADLTNQAGARHADEIWLCKITGGAEKLAAEAYPQARIVLYEDGIHTYVSAPVGPWHMQMPVKHPRDAIKLTKRAARYCVDGKVRKWVYLQGSANIYRRHLRRVDRAYLYLCKIVPVPDHLRAVHVYQLEDEVVRRTLSSCGSLPHVQAAIESSSDLSARRVLVLGQCLAQRSQMARSEELAIYSQIISALLEKGYSVIWKDHPRVHESYFKDLAPLASRDRLMELKLPAAYPVEAIAEKVEFVGCVSGMSTSLIYLSELYGTSPYTFAERLASFMKEDFTSMNRHILSLVPSISTLAEASA
jgi:hypothetical protein